MAKDIANNLKNLIDRGFFLIPLIPNSKLPAKEGWPKHATRDPEKIDALLRENPKFNFGIITEKFNGEGEALLAVDIDSKKRGEETLLKLEMQGFDFPQTFTQITPTGGKHLIYKVKTAVKQGVDVLGPGLDIRSKGGYLVSAGSSINGKKYEAVEHEIVMAPEWLIHKCGLAREKLLEPIDLSNVNTDFAMKRAIHYLQNEAPLALEGEGGDHTTFAVACRVKDIGLNLADSIDVLLKYWNDRCRPPWNFEDLEAKIKNAFRYGENPPGVAAPETQFTAVKKEGSLHPFEEINKEHALVSSGGGVHILHETTGTNGNFKLEHMSLDAFHTILAPKTMIVGEKTFQTSRLWIKSGKRREYRGICFNPERETPKGFYNLWRGFSVQLPTNALPEKAHKALEMYLSHAKENICNNEEFLFKWLMSYFAQLIQKPWEKVRSGVVFTGRKGVGKNVFVQTIGRLMQSNYLLTSNRRYLVGNFNGHLENLLLFVFDEAFWSGDKQSEGILKDLITGDMHNIERKGQEPYTVENRARICILSNEEWVIPASPDERRFAVFTVGDGRKQDTKFFREMLEGMEVGGYSLLLEYLKKFDMSGINLNIPPNTQGLKEQKEATLDPFYQWWRDCLQDGEISGLEFSEDWPQELDKKKFRTAFRQYSKERQIKSRLPNDVHLGRMFRKCCPSVDTEGRMLTYTGRTRVYRLPSLEICRREWENFIGHIEFGEL